MWSTDRIYPPGGCSARARRSRCRELEPGARDVLPVRPATGQDAGMASGADDGPAPTAGVLSRRDVLRRSVLAAGVGAIAPFTFVRDARARDDAIRRHM